MSETSSPPLAEPLEDFPGYQLRRVSAASMAQLAAALAQQHLSPTAATTLLMIDANPGETQARIARALAIQRANMAPLVARLENAGLVKRTICDGRSYGLACTARGRTAAETVKKIMAEHEASVFGALSQKDQAKLMELLLKLRRGRTSKA